jgi:tetratricopeptide (TPR) repeat protein
MMEQTGPPFLDVPVLLESSEPRPGILWPNIFIAGSSLAIFLGWYIGRSTENASLRQSLPTLVAMSVTAAMAGLAIRGFARMRRIRAEQSTVMAIEEMIQLRRWPEAAMTLQSLLSQPAMSPFARAQALLYLAMVLARYHRFEESVSVHDYVLERIPLDDVTDHFVRMGRVMALLREDNLLDADRGIAELRRATRGTESAGLALVEIYRDVKTGHPTEALEMFEKRLAILRRDLGHRVADVWALAARAYDLLNRTEEAKTAYENATLLAPLGELTRRYPEIAAMNGRYVPSPAPAEVA